MLSHCLLQSGGAGGFLVKAANFFSRSAYCVALAAEKIFF